MPEELPHWRRPVERSPHNRAWLAVLIGAVATFLLLEVPAFGRAVLNDTASEAVWAVARPFNAWWWLVMPPFTGLCLWLPPHFALRWGNGVDLAVLVAFSYLLAVIVWLVVKGAV